MCIGFILHGHFIDPVMNDAFAKNFRFFKYLMSTKTSCIEQIGHHSSKRRMPNLPKVLFLIDVYLENHILFYRATILGQ